MLPVGQDQPSDCNHVHASNGLADDRVGVVPHLAVRHEIVGPDDVTLVDILPRHELVDLDRMGTFEGNVVQFVLADLDVGIGIDLVSLHDVFRRDFFPGLGVDLLVFDAVSGRSIDLVEADLFRIGRGGKQGDGAGHKGKAQKTLPVGAGGHWDTPG